jgi:hypothetical protein
MVHRRQFLSIGAALPLVGAEKTVRREVFIPSPGKGTAIMAYAFYSKATGTDMISIEQRWSRSDTIDISYVRRSKDNGKTWSEPRAMPTGEKRAGGMWRKHPRAGYVDAKTGRYLEFWNEGTLPSDDPLEGMRQWMLFYRLGPSGPAVQVIHEGAEYSAQHPMPGIFIGKNALMLGDQSSVPITARDGRIILPLEVPPLGDDGKPHNPTGGYTYTDGLLVHGRWVKDRLLWRASERIPGDPARSTRGMVEPTIEFLDDGRLIVILRGSNDKNHALPAHKWICFSSDGGYKFTKPVPWTYDTGETFFSPSSCSQLLKHSSGRLFWLGNLNAENPKGNRPRFPFVIGEVDRKSGLLRKSSVRTVDTRQPGEHEILSLSNFYAREDRVTRNVALHMTRLFAHNDGWEGDAMLYQIEV